MSLPNESHFEANTIERLKRLGYAHQSGPELRERDDFPLDEVVLRDALGQHLRARYRELPAEAIERAISRIVNPNGVTFLHRNLEFHRLLTRGFELKYETAAGKEEHAHIYPIDWGEATANDFRVVGQLPIHGHNDRRPDLIVYINGLPLVVFELKNPYDAEPTVAGAHNQLGHYTVDIPRLFDFNAFAVISDGANTLHGMPSGEMEWFAPWKTIDGRNIEPTTTGSMKTLIEGLFPKDRLLEYIRQFVVFERVNEGINKKGAKYHQFFGVRFAVEEALRATAPDGDRKIGVVWHTQGSGKSLSMVFFVGILQRRLQNPTFVIQVDRTDLDDQLYDNFVAAGALVGGVEHAESVEELRELLQTGGGGVIFTTIEKFRLRENEKHHPVLSERRNLIVIADEAHRTQYGLREGYAYHLRHALPNASFIGFTGTPIDFAGRDTQSVFGDVIHTYDIPQAQADGAIVPIYYEPRLARLHLVNEEVDEELEEIAEGEEIAAREKTKWAAIEFAAGAEDRVAAVARDIVEHFEKRSEALFGKGMIVCMSRRICVALFDEVVALRPDWHDARYDAGRIKVVMTGDISEDPKEWNAAGHITTKERREKLKARLKDPADPLQLVIVRDMWLTGTDVPCLSTLYVDKPMKGHSLMQAIARVNRVFSDKPGGLVVDYIGVGHRLKKAARKYTSDGFGAPTEELNELARAKFFAELAAITQQLPGQTDGAGWPAWRDLPGIELEDLCALVWGSLSATDAARDEFLQAEKRLSAAFSLVNHLDDCRARADEVSFCQIIRAGLKKTMAEPGAARSSKERQQAVRDLIDRSLQSDGVVDIFKAAGLERPDISILDEQFLEEYTSHPQENLRLKLLEKLLADEVKLHERRNLKKYRSFKDLLEEMLRRYHSNTITAAEVLQTMVEIRQQMSAEDRRKQETGLGDEELAFYDAIEGLRQQAYDMPFLCDLVREVVEAVRRKLKVDWTKPHRQNIKADVQAAVKLVLRRKGVRAEQFEFILRRVMEQAEALYADWPLAA
jgi:type I restriction enzyme R subunit